MSTCILVGDVRERLAELPDRSVHCIVTSPPYFGLRDYGTAQWEGGEAGCEHKQRTTEGIRNNGRDRAASNGRFHEGIKTELVLGVPFRDLCGHCGARRIDSQIGLEPTPDAYVATLVAVFREARRVLRDDGTLWLNLGDSYSGGKTGRDDNTGADLIRRAAAYGTGTGEGRGPTNGTPRPILPGMKPKDLMMLPARVALALQADGWTLRSDIIWHKPNPMPESVTDRPTSAHEHVFLFAKQARYYYDAEAVKEAVTSDAGNRPTFRGGGVYTGGRSFNNSRTVPNDSLGNVPNELATRNLRNVWTIASQSYAEAHFATFPPDLVEPCIKAGCPRGGMVLDPFGGAGTTALVADRLGRDCILIELNPAYADLAVRRIEQDAGLFAAVTQEAAE